jgi:hypothetical protein
MFGFSPAAKADWQRITAKAKTRELTQTTLERGNLIADRNKWSGRKFPRHDT